MSEMQSKVGTRARMAWVDVAKAASILLVVLYHAYDGEYRWVAWAPQLPIVHWWGVLNEGLKSVRMPLFFLASGLLASASIGRAWEVIARKRVYNPAYLYLLWAVILSLFFSLFRFINGSPDEPLADKLLFLILGVSWAWYLGALPAFFMIARMTRNMTAWMPIAGAFLLGIVADMNLVELPWSTSSMMRSLAFFLAGARLPDLARTIAERPARHLAAGLPMLLLAGAVMGRLPGAGPAISIAAVWVGIALASLAARIENLRDAGTWLGARTLPIYILHFPVLAVLGELFRSWLTKPLLASNGVAIAFPLVLAAAAVPISLVVHRLILSVGGGWLFALPEISRRSFRLAPAAG